MLVRSPLLSSYKWRELVSSGCLIYRCHHVFLWGCVCFVLLRFRLYAFVEAAALRSIVHRYAGAPIATRAFLSSFFFLLFIWRCRFFRVFFVPLPFSLLYGEYVVRPFFPNDVFYLVTTGWILDISICKSSANQSNT